MENNQRNIKDYDYNFKASSEAIDAYHANRQKKTSEKNAVKLILSIFNLAIILPSVAKYLLLMFILGGLDGEVSDAYIILFGGIIYVVVSIICFIKYVWEFYR